jgi:ParB family chromosome partitioning protein
MASDKYAPHIERLRAVAGSLKGRLIAIGGAREASGEAADARLADPTAVHVLTAGKGKPQAALEAGSAVNALCFLADDLLIAGCESGALQGWDAGAEAPLRSIDIAGAEPITALACDPLGKTLAVADAGGTLRLFELTVDGGTPSLAPRGTRALSGRPLRAVAFDPQSGVIAAGGDDGVVRSFTSADGALTAEVVLREMPCGEGGVGALLLPGDGRVVAGCGDGSLRVCYLEGAADQENRAGEAAHGGAVRALAYGPRLTDEADRELPRRLFSIANDGVLKAWQLDTKRKPRSLELSSIPLWGMAHLPASGRAKADKRGGTLAIIDRKRRLTLVTVDERSEPSESTTRFKGELARLREDARGGNEKVRTTALEALAPLTEDEARRELDRALGDDKKPAVRLRVAQLLEQTAQGPGRRLSRPSLRKALDDEDKKVRAAAFAALKAIEHDAAVSSLRAALRSRHADLRLAAVEALPALRQRSPLVPGLIAGALRDADEKVRRSALAALWQLEDDPTALAPVRTALARGPEDVRAEALLRLGLARRATDAEGRALLEGAFDDEAKAVRSRALLVAIAARPTLAARLWVVDPHTGRALAELRKLAAKLVEGGTLADEVEGDPLELHLDDERELQPLFAALASRNADTALRGARCLALLPDPRATGALLSLSREGDEETRRFAVEALLAAAMAMPADDRLAARLEWLLDDEDATVRTWAFEALIKLASGGGPEALLDVVELALKTAYDDVRVRALSRLAPFGGDGKHAKDGELAPRADGLLGAALDDEASKVRGEAFRTLSAWNAKALEPALARAARSRHADIRLRVVNEAAKQQNDWADALLLERIGDSSAEVGAAAYRALTEVADDAKAKLKKRRDKSRKREELHQAALGSPRASVRQLGCVGAGSWAENSPAVMTRLRELVDDEHPPVHTAAIEATDALSWRVRRDKGSWPDDQEAFVRAFNSRYIALQVRAGELLGTRRDDRAVEPMKRLLSIPQGELDRPSDELRQRAARALADVGHTKSIAFYCALLDDEDGVVREMGARGLATACGPGEEQPLIDALAHEDLAVRSWAAEGLARLGDDRAVPVLAGTLKHEHRPIRLGAILSFVALGPDGLRGILQGLEDPDREIQDLVFGIIVARDLALARAGQQPDLLLSALSSAHPEIRFAAARCLEHRDDNEVVSELAQQLVGPTRPERAAEMKDWPAEGKRSSLLNVLIGALASDHPLKRYAAARVLSLRPQALAFWREVEGLSGPRPSDRAPFTSWEDDETRQPRKRDWIRRLFGRRHAPPAQSGTERVLTLLRYAGSPEGGAPPTEKASFDDAEVKRLAFGTYAGLVRQAPPSGEADETHRVRRDSLERLGELATDERVGRGAVLPVFRRALSDPHNMVRKAALSALTGLYDAGALEPYGLALESTAADIGRGAVDALVDAAAAGNEQAAELTRGALAAGSAEVRAYALARLPKLYDDGSLEPWLLALGAQHADVRMAVVDRLADARDPRVAGALERAMESDHEDLRLKAATVLAHRGDVRTVDVLAGLLRSEQGSLATDARGALIALAHARTADSSEQQRQQAAAAAAEAIANRVSDDPDQTADKNALIDALARIHSPAAGDTLQGLIDDEASDAPLRRRCFDALRAIAQSETARPQLLADGRQRQRYDEALLLGWAERLVTCRDAELRQELAQLLRDIDDPAAESLLGKLVEDREQAVRVAAAEALAFRAEVVAGATTDVLAATLRGGRRELVLPAAAGLAARGRPEAFQALLLVLKAGEGAERERATLLLGSLGDKRALEELEPLADPRAELEDEDKRLAPAATEALGRMLPHLEGDERDRVRERVESQLREGNRTIRERAMVGLRHAGDDRSRSLIEALASDRYDDEQLRRAAVRELGLLPTSESSEACLAELLGAQDRGLRQAALAALERQLNDRTRTSLLALKSSWLDISQPAATFLARRGDPETLVERLGEVEDEDIRRQLRQGLVRREACPEQALRGLLEGEATGPRVDAAWIVGAARQQPLAAPLVEATRRAANEWREGREQLLGLGRDEAGRKLQEQRGQAWRAGLWALRRLAEEDAADGKAQAMAREALGQAKAPPAVRHEALRVLASGGSGSDLTLIEPCLSDGDARVRAAAAAATARLAPERSASILGSLTVADGAALTPVINAALPSAASSLLGEARTRALVLPTVLGRGEVEALTGVARASGKDPARLVAIAALGRAGGDLARQALEAILAQDGEEDAVRAAAFRALRRLQRAAEAADRYGEDDDKDSGSYSGYGGWDDDDDDDWDDDDDDDDWDDDDDDDDWDEDDDD